MSDTPAPTPSLQWELGTAYELFISLYVMHMPEHFGVRASWAAGVRSRIPATERKLLEEIIPFTGFPLGWIHTLPGEKDAISALWALKQLPPAERLPRLLNLECCESEWEKVLLGITQRGKWEASDLEVLKGMAHKETARKLKEADMICFLDRWAKPAELGEGFLTALHAFHQAFFEEEEQRVRPVLQAGLERARQMAGRLSVEALLRELSQGVQLGDLLEAKNLVIIPAYWTTPLILYLPAREDTMLFFFGARPLGMPAIPGEMVPDSLLRALKALADPTRLKILYYLTQDELTPSELARRLHLRAPTVTHHLGELRLSGLVNVSIKGQEKLFRARSEALDGLVGNLNDFLRTRKSGD